MKTNDPYKLGEHDEAIKNLKKEDGDLDDRLKTVERYISLQKLAIGKCTALWGFIVTGLIAVGGFVSYHFTQVKAAIIAGFRAFYNGN